MNPANRFERAARFLAVASAVSLIAYACSGSSPAASTAGSTSAATAAAASSPAAPTTASPARSAKPTPIPTLPSTTEDATVAPSGAISMKMAWEAPRFAPDQVTAKAGTVVFFLQMSPRGSLGDHNMAIGPKIYKVLARSSFVHQYKSAVFTVESLAPGVYTFWCEVPEHAANGMVGTLTITP